MAAQSPDQMLLSVPPSLSLLMVDMEQLRKSQSQSGLFTICQSLPPNPPTDYYSQWRERRDLALADREKISVSKKEETISAARSAIDDFYENYTQKTEKTVAKTRKEAEEFLANREDTSAGGTSWERIAKLVDLSGKGSKGGASGTGKEKFREMLLDLRKDEKAPGAIGV